MADQKPKASPEELLVMYRTEIAKLEAESAQLKAAQKKLRLEAIGRGEDLPRYKQPAQLSQDLAKWRSKLYYIENAEERKEKSRAYRARGKTRADDD